MHEIPAPVCKLLFVGMISEKNLLAILADFCDSFGNSEMVFVRTLFFLKSSLLRLRSHRFA
jgi:hypothetical protein